MPPLLSGLTRGLAAGAVGTTVLNAVTYLDMALTGRPASDAPAELVGAAGGLVGVDVDTSGARAQASGTLAGLATGLAVGAVTGLVRASGVRLPLPVEATVVGAGAMAASDGPLAVLGVSDPTTWAGTDWLRDVVPHLAYGVTTAGVLRRLEPDPAAHARRPRRGSGRVLARSLAIGLASGARSSLGLVPPALASDRLLPSLVSGALVVGELGIDKLPSAPSRIGGATVARVGTAALGAATLARHEDVGMAPAVAAGALGAVVGSVLGVVWRDVCAERSWAWQGAVVEDAVALGLTAWAWRA